MEIKTSVIDSYIVSLGYNIKKSMTGAFFVSI